MTLPPTFQLMKDHQEMDREESLFHFIIESERFRDEGVDLYPSHKMWEILKKVKK